MTKQFEVVLWIEKIHLMKLGRILHIMIGLLSAVYIVLFSIFALSRNISSRHLRKSCQLAITMHYYPKVKPQ